MKKSDFWRLKLTKALIRYHDIVGVVIRVVAYLVAVMYRYI